MDHGPGIKNVFDDLPPDLERLRTLRVRHALWLARIDQKIAALTKRQAEAEHGRERRPAHGSGSPNSASAPAARLSRSTQATATWPANGGDPSTGRRPRVSSLSGNSAAPVQRTQQRPGRESGALHRCSGGPYAST